jgi:hypothetical protein
MTPFYRFSGSDLAIHTDQEFCIVSRSFHTLKQEFHRLLRSHVTH